MSMSILNFFYHLFIFLIGVLVSIPFVLLLIYNYTSNDYIHPVTSLLFSTKPDILTIPTNEVPFHSVWMFGILTTHIKLSSRVKLQPIYLKLYRQYLFIHLTSKRIKNFNRNKIFFSEVIIFDLHQAKIELKPYEQVRTQYWSNKTPIILSKLQYLARYRINKKKKNQKLVFKWFIDEDEIHLYTLTMRSKEEWFYRLYNTIKSDFNCRTKTNSNPPIDQIEIEYNPKASSLHIDENFSNNQTWRGSMLNFFERIHLLPSINNPDESEKLNNDYFCLINNLISRCAKTFYEKLDAKNKIQHELKHLKLPSYIQWIRLSNFHFDNVYPRMQKLKKIWFNHDGLWIAIDLIYQANLSLEFTIQIDLIHKQNKYSFLPKPFQRWMNFRNNIQVLRKIINTILIITINIRSINGILLINIPSPPSDRIWFGFEEMPLIDFDVYHRQISSNSKENKSQELNQLQTAINHLLSQWIKKQIRKECVLPNMRDLSMKWCDNPFENDHLLILKKSRINHLLWFNETDFEKDLLTKKIYLIAQWKENNLSKHQKEKLLLQKRIFSTERFLIFEHY